MTKTSSTNDCNCLGVLGGTCCNQPIINFLQKTILWVTYHENLVKGDGIYAWSRKLWQCIINIIRYHSLSWLISKPHFTRNPFRWKISPSWMRRTCFCIPPKPNCKVLLMPAVIYKIVNIKGKIKKVQCLAWWTTLANSLWWIKGIPSFIIIPSASSCHGKLSSILLSFTYDNNTLKCRDIGIGCPKDQSKKTGQLKKNNQPQNT